MRAYIHLQVGPMYAHAGEVGGMGAGVRLLMQVDEYLWRGGAIYVQICLCKRTPNTCIHRFKYLWRVGAASTQVLFTLVSLEADENAHTPHTYVMHLYDIITR